MGVGITYSHGDFLVRVVGWFRYKECIQKLLYEEEPRDVDGLELKPESNLFAKPTDCLAQPHSKSADQVPCM